MVRRAVGIASVLGALSAAGALAFAREITMAGKALVTAAPWTGRAFTPVPRSIAQHFSIGARSLPSGDSLQGRYCRFPPNGTDPHDNAEDADPRGAPELDSLGILKLQGQSAAPSASDTSAMCTGQSVSTAPRSVIP